MGAPIGNKNASGPHKGGGFGKKKRPNFGQMYRFNPKTHRSELKPYYRRKMANKRKATMKKIYG